MTLNASERHLIVAGYKDELLFASAEHALLWEEQSAKLLQIFIDSSLKFDDHVKMISTKSSQKLTAISRMAIFESQVNYYPIIWIFCGRTLNHRLNQLHERTLRIAYDDYELNSEEVP